MKRGIRFKVFEGINKEAFHFHIIAGNSEIVAPSESYPDARTAHKSVRGLWAGFAKALGLLGELPPIPYTKDSLKP